jgi:hypothetical protein
MQAAHWPNRFHYSGKRRTVKITARAVRQHTLSFKWAKPRGDKPPRSVLGRDDKRCPNGRAFEVPPLGAVET